MPKPLIDMKNLTKTYTLGGETFKALDDVTFTVEQGEFYPWLARPVPVNLL